MKTDEQRLSPTSRLLDPQFPYVRSDLTNLRESFRKWGWVPPSEVKRKQEQETT